MLTLWRPCCSLRSRRHVHGQRMISPASGTLQPSRSSTTSSVCLSSSRKCQVGTSECMNERRNEGWFSVVNRRSYHSPIHHRMTFCPLTISVWSAVTTVYCIPSERAAKWPASFQVEILGQSMHFMNRELGMLCILWKYDNEWVRWAVLYYIDDTVHSSSSRFTLSLSSPLASKYR